MSASGCAGCPATQEEAAMKDQVETTTARKTSDGKLPLLPQAAPPKSDCGDGSCGCGCGLPIMRQ